MCEMIERRADFSLYDFCRVLDYGKFQKGLELMYGG